MKKEIHFSISLPNPRVLFGLFVMLAGVFLALVSFGPATTGFAQVTTREEMTLTLAQALNLPQPPACVPGAEMFNDVPASSPFCPFIEELARLGISGGCGGGNYCPGDPVTRQQMAAFVVKALLAGNLKFTNLTMKNGWVGNCNGGGVPQVALGLDGTVHLRGEMCRTSGGSVNPFDVPANMRPSVSRVDLTAAQFDRATGLIVIGNSGNALVGSDPEHPTAAFTFTSLNGLTYNP
jgi:S-layer homology domain